MDQRDHLIFLENEIARTRAEMAMINRKLDLILIHHKIISPKALALIESDRDKMLNAVAEVLAQELRTLWQRSDDVGQN